MGNEAKNGPNIGYGVLEKGAEYTRSNYAKPRSSNDYSIVLDTGQALVKGRCYDHHQLSQEDKVRFPSATSMVYAYADEIYEVNKQAVEDGSKINLICHDFPDTDAILSVALAKQILEHGGELPIGAEQLVNYANASDTFTFKPGFGFGALLTTIIQEEYRNARTFQQKKEAIDTCVYFTEAMLKEYQALIAKEPDEEKRNEINLDTTLQSLMRKDSEYRRKQQGNWKYFHKCKEKIDSKTQDSIRAFDQMVDIQSKRGSEYNNGEIASRDSKVKTRVNSNLASYELFDVNLCKMQTTKEEQEQPFETSITPCNVFVYTGSKPFDSVMDLRAKENFDVTIVPKYDYEKGTVTIKISSQVEGLDLGHFGRYIESLIYQESLDKTKSPLKGEDFKRRKEEFTRRLKPYAKGLEDKHFTTYEPTCGNDPTFFGYKVPLESNLASLAFLRDSMETYFEDPQKIYQEEFEEIVGKENIDELNEEKRPKENEQDGAKKKSVIFVSNSRDGKRETREIRKPERKSELEEIAEQIVEANLDENDVDKEISDAVDALIESEEETIINSDEDVLE